MNSIRKADTEAGKTGVFRDSLETYVLTDGVRVPLADLGFMSEDELLTFLKAEGAAAEAAGKSVGEVWESKNKPGRWFTLKESGGKKRVVPAKNPSPKVAAPKPPKAPSQATQKREGKTKAEAQKTAGRTAVADVGTKLRDGGEITVDEAKSFNENLKHLTAPELKQLNKVIGAKVSGAKAKLIDQLVQHAIAKSSGQASPVAKEKKVQQPTDNATPHAKTRAGLDALGIAHDHLSDDDLHAKLKGALGGGKTKPTVNVDLSGEGKALADDLKGKIAEVEKNPHAATDEEVAGFLDRFNKLKLPEKKSLVAAVTGAKATDGHDALLRLKTALIGTRQHLDSQLA